MTDVEQTRRSYGDPDVLAGTFEGGTAYVKWAAALDGLSPEDATRAPEGCPHSVADVTAHTLYWYEWLLGHARGERPAWPEHAEDGWPEVDAAGWETRRARLLSVLDELRERSLDVDFLATPSFKGATWGRTLLGFSFHGAYHLGQVVLIRRMLGAWPPPGGGDTW
ncbi:DinB family protein [Deinococcus pimensis]|uniref:DinB family protein n=1 Tax=Deinococcus pimensis TaxID=309888 RepID=UPI0004B3D141|nr:DinB family protein [Deinococcus pimensis]